MKNIMKQLRIQKKLTQDELAEILGVARPTISNIERERCSPRYSLMCKVANYFGKPVEHIFFENIVLQEEQEGE